MKRLSLSWTVALVSLTVSLLSASVFARPSNDSRCSLEHDVAIIGAGISGAYSAFKLRHEGLSIGMYEYSDRIGGRVYTEQLPGVPDQNLELGAMRFINNIHVLLQDLVREHNLTEKIFHYTKDEPYEDRVFRRNVSMTVTEFSTGDIPYNLTEEEKANQPDLLKYLLEKLTGDPLNNVTEENVFDLTVPDGRYLYQLSAPEALGLVASPEGMAYLLTGSDYNSEEISAVEMVYELFGPNGDYGKRDVFTVVEGFVEIVNATINKFLDASPSHSLEMNMKLLSIRGVAGSYRLRFRRTVTANDETIELHNRNSEDTVCAKKVILAIPKVPLVQVDWKPLRSRRYKDLLEGTFLVHASKVFMTYPSPWWLEEARYPTRTLVATGLGQVYDWGQSEVTGDWTLLVSYNKQLATAAQWVANNGLDISLLEDSNGGVVDPTEEDSVMVEPDSILPRIHGSVYGENRVTAPLKDYLHRRLAMAFGIPKCGIPEPVASIGRFWNRYPYGGGWVYTRPGYRYDELLTGYRRPSKIDDIFVVGTDYSARDTIGWCEGALFTVEKVMEEFFQVGPGASVRG